MLLKALFLSLVTVVIAITSSPVGDPSWTWELLSPGANSSITPFNPASQFNLTVISAPKSNLFIELDGNLTFSVLLEFGGSSYFLPAPTNPFVSEYHNITAVVDIWVPLEFNLTLLDPSTNASTNYSTSIASSSWHGDLIPSYSLVVFPPFGDVLPLFWETSNEEDFLYCEWTAIGQNKTSNRAEQLDANTFTCAFFYPPLWEAGSAIEMSLAVCQLTMNNSYSCEEVDGKVPFIQSAMWSHVNQSDWICDGHNITIEGTFYPDRYYTCVFCWDADENTLQLAESALPHTNGTLLTCTIDLVPNAATSVADLCYIVESLQPAISFSNTTYIPGPVPRAYGLGAYFCPSKKTFWKPWMTIVSVLVGVALGVIVIAVILRASKSTSPERQPLRRNNADA